MRQDIGRALVQRNLAMDGQEVSANMFASNPPRRLGQPHLA